MPDYRLGRLKGQFVVVWEEEGRRRRWRLGSSDPREARAKLQEFVKERERLQRPNAELTVADIWADYVAEKRAEGRISVGRIEDAWKQVGPAFSSYRSTDVTAEAARGYISQRRNRGASDGTIHTELGYLRAALRRAASIGSIASAPVFSLPSKPRPRTRHLTPGEARRLLDGSRMPHVRLFIMLALHTAGRPSSILDLTWDRIDFKSGRIYLDNPERSRTPKGRATVPLAQELVGPLQDSKKAALTSYVIEWAGEPVKSIKKAIGRSADRAGLRGVVTPYVLRHTAAVWMAEGGVPMSEISQYLGHTSTAVTERVYARYSPEHLQKAAKAISDRLADTGDAGRAEPKARGKAGTKKARKANADNPKRPKR